MRCVIAEIKDALPVRAAVPIHPRGETEIRAVRHVRGKLNETIRAVETHRLPGVTVGETGRTGHHTVVAVAACVERVRLEKKLRETARTVVGNRLRVGERGNLVAVSHARRGDGAGAVHERTSVLDPVVKLVAFHERRGFEHGNHCRDARLLLLRVSRHGPLRVRPVRAVVPFREPDGAMRVVPNIEEEIIQLRRTTGGVGGIVRLIIMHRAKIHAQSGGVRLRDERIQPRRTSAIRRRGRTDAQTGAEQIGPRINRVADENVCLTATVRFVVTEDGVRAARLPILTESRPVALRADSYQETFC